MAAPREIEGYRIMPVKFCEKSKAVFYLFYKNHQVKNTHPLKPSNKTLLVINIPPYCDEPSLKNLFRDAGEVKHVYFHKKPTSGPPLPQSSSLFAEDTTIKGFKVAYVVFNNESCVQKALALEFLEPKILSTPEHRILVGFRKWCQEYNESFVDPVELQKEIDTFMAEYDKKVEEEKRKEKELEGKPDEEGWVTVTRHGKKPGFARTENTLNKITKKDQKRKSKKQLLNFYTFQIRESKMESVAQLRKKFEEDKKRIAMMKASRKFKPF